MEVWIEARSVTSARGFHKIAYDVVTLHGATVRPEGHALFTTAMGARIWAIQTHRIMDCPRRLPAQLETAELGV